MISFYVNDDFKIKVGKDQKEFTIPRMKFLTGEKVVQKIAEVQAKDIKGAVNLLIKVKNGDNKIVSDISETVKTLINEKNFGIVLSIIDLVSEHVLNEKLLRETDCQYDEVLKILVYLIENNFSSLKNLSASLQAITSSGQ
jgi:hypothetical protein